MKRYLKWILIAAVTVTVAAAAILAAYILTPKAPDYEFPAFVDSYEKSKSYTSLDDNIVFDGVLDDAAWKDQRWLEVKHITEESIGVKMTSYFGEDGLYMAFDVDDLGVFFDEKRDAAYNSGIQLYISSMDGAKNITGHGYEISLAAGGQVKVKKYTGSAYELYLGRVYTEAVIKGQLNTEDAKGYTMEAYIDYALLGEDCKQVYVNAAIVRSMSESGTDRQWYSFGQNDRGAAWTRAETWWSFDTKGLIAYDVRFETGSNGIAQGKAYVPGGDDYTFCIVPDQGYYAKAVQIGAQDLTAALYYMDGKAYCTVENVHNDLDIQIDFAQVAQQTMAVSGQISSMEGTVTGAKLWAVLGGYTQQIPVSADGSFTGTVPAADALQLFAAAEGYVPCLVSAQEGEHSILLEKMYFGENEAVERKTSNMSPWDLNRLYLDRVRLKTTDYAMELVNSEIYGKSVYASAKLKTDVKQGVDTRAGFTFYVNKDMSIFVALTMNGEVNQYNPEGKVNCTIQLITEIKGERFWGPGGIIVPIENQEKIMELAAGEGVPFVVHYNKGLVDVWVAGQQVGYGLYSKDANGYNRLGDHTQVAVGLQCWSSRAVYEDLRFDGNYPERRYPSAPDWNLSGLGSGVAISESGKNWSSAMLSTKYYNKLCMTANVPLIAKTGVDLRAGFLLKNPKGKEVFVALTANGEKNTNNPNGDFYYTVQVISGGYASWKVDGKITDTRSWEELRDLVENGGVPMTVYIEDGKLTIGVNGYVVAENVVPLNKDGTPILAGNLSVAPGLATARTALKFTNVSYSTEKPELKDSNRRGWDLSGLQEGVVSRVQKPSKAEIVIWDTLRQKYYLESDISFPAAAEDVRAGFRFSDPDGNRVFAALLRAADGAYAVQMIASPATGGFYWTWNYRLNGITTLPEGGLPFGVAYANGGFDIWCDGIKIGDDIIPMVNGEPVFTEDDLVRAGLECWSTTAEFMNLAAYDINDAPQAAVTTTQVEITEGYAETDKYVVFSARLRSLTELKHDWSRNAILSISGKDNWQNYAFQIVYGTSSDKNLIKLNNNKGYDGVNILQEQWYNNAKLEKLFDQTGIEVKLIRMDTKAYLLVDMGDGFERVGVMQLPENAPTQIKLFAANMDVRLNRVTVEVGKEAAEKALEIGSADVLISSKGAASSTLIPGDYTDANYAVFEANIKALDAITYDWNSNIVVSVSGNAKWDKYDFQILYGTSANRNLVKLTNNTAGTFDGITVTQEQNINHPAFEKTFTAEGMNIKVVRLNTWAYLLVDMGEGFTLVGKMYIPANQPTQFSVYNSKVGVQISDFRVSTGEAAALKALDGIALKVDQLANAFAVPVNGTQWTIEGKVSFANFAAAADYRFTISSNKSEWKRMTLAYIYGQSKWKGQSVAQVSGSWASADIPNGQLLTGDGLWTRWVRDGGILSLYVSLDRENWTYVQNCDNCGTNSGIIYIFEANGDENPLMKNLRIRAGLPEDDTQEEPEGNEPIQPDRQIASITLKDLPDQVIYRVGDSFQIADASYQVRYDNGDVEFGAITPDMCSEVDMTKSGVQTVQVKVNHNGAEALLSFTVEIIGDPEEYEPIVP